MKLEEVERLIGQHYGTDEYDWHEWKYEVGTESIDVVGLGVVTVVDEYGGEGQGDEYWIAFRVEFAEGPIRFFRMNGYYASYDGGTFDGPFEEVQPVEKTITVFEVVR